MTECMKNWYYGAPCFRMSLVKTNKSIYSYSGTNASTLFRPDWFEHLRRKWGLCIDFLQKRQYFAVNMVKALRIYIFVALLAIFALPTYDEHSCKGKPPGKKHQKKGVKMPKGLKARTLRVKKLSITSRMSKKFTLWPWWSSTRLASEGRHWRRLLHRSLSPLAMALYG